MESLVLVVAYLLQRRPQRIALASQARVLVLELLIEALYSRHVGAEGGYVSHFGALAYAKKSAGIAEAFA